MVGLHIRFQIYGQKHLQIEGKLSGPCGQWVEHGFVHIYGSIIHIQWIKYESFCYFPSNLSKSSFETINKILHFCGVKQEFLRNKAYPLLESCSSFLLDWLIPGQGGFLETNPSTSPEHMFTAPDGKPASVSNSSTMDMAIIKEVFSSILSAAEV